MVKVLKDKFKKVKANIDIEKVPKKMKDEINNHKSDIIKRFDKKTYDAMVNRKLPRYEISRLLTEAIKGD